MARFRGTIRGSRGEASRLGNSTSGITGHVAGWDSGVRVTGEAMKGDGGDKFYVEITTGSNNRRGGRTVAEVEDHEGKQWIKLYSPETGEIVYPAPAPVNTPTAPPATTPSHPRYTAPFGSREIYRDGKPFIVIARSRDAHRTTGEPDGYVSPSEVDDVSREILRLLNAAGR